MNLIAQDTCPTSNVPYGFCHCGCGGRTRLATQNHSKHSHIKGEPYLYILGHGAKKKRLHLDHIPFLFDGDWCRRIPLTQNLYTIVDASDYEYLMQWAWHVSSSGLTHYAVRQEYVTKQLICMHRLIMNAPNDLEVDHKNLNGLDNRRHNLRWATNTQNAGNRRLPVTNTSGFKGVHLLPNNKYRAMIVHKGIYHHLGCFLSAEEAAEAYWKKAVELRGEFARRF